VISRYACSARTTVHIGQLVRRGESLASRSDCSTPTVELRRDAAFDVAREASAAVDAWRDGVQVDPVTFAREHAQLLDPAHERQLIVIDQAQYRLALYERGHLFREVEIGLGQEKGQKRRLKDLRTPKGAYFIVDKVKGAMSGKWAVFYGGYWIKINYPGPEDARWGVENHVIDAATAARISDAWQRRELTPQNTRLGGGVGFHGWASEWDGKGGAHLSFGCVVFHTPDIAALYDRISSVTMVVIY